LRFDFDHYFKPEEGFSLQMSYPLAV